MPTTLTLQSTVERPQKNRGQILTLALLAMAAVFVVDLFLPMGIAEGVLYVAVVLIALRSPDKNDPLRMAGLCTLLTVVGFFLSPSGTEPWVGITNRLIAVLIVWSTALLAMQVRETDAATREQSNMLAAILSNMPAVLFRIDREGTMRESIGRGLACFGLKDLTNIGRLPLEPPEPIRKQVKEGNLTKPVFYESRGVFQGKPWWYLNCLCKLQPDRQEIIGFGIDISDRKRAERRLATHDAITAVLANTTDMTEAFPQILKAVCETLGWKVGILWRMDYQRQALGAAAVWPPDSSQAQAMSQQTSAWELTPDVGLAGLVWEIRKPLWIKDLADYPKDPRNQTALQHGIHAGFAIPVTLAGNMRAVLEFFSSFSEEADETLLQLLSSIGFQIAQFIEREQKERRLAAHHALTNVLAESTDLAQASGFILEAICENLRWDLGALWQLDSSQNVLRCIRVWYSPHLPLQAFEQVSKDMTFSRGVGLPGRVWKSGEPTWITDVVVAPNSPRATIANQEGLHAGVGFPIRFGTGIVGVMEFFHRDIQAPDKELLQMFKSIGLQIGQFIQRTTPPSSSV